MTTPEPCDLLIRNAHVLTADDKRTAISPGAIAISRSTIVAVGPTDAIEASYRPASVIDARGGLVHPGLIDMHYHATFHMVGKMIQEIDPRTTEPGPFVANQYQGMINATDEEGEYANALLACLDMLKCGVTSFMDPGTSSYPDAIARAAGGLGMRASVADPWLWDIKGPQMNAIDRGPVDRERAMRLLGGQLWRNEDPEALVRGHVSIFGMGSQSDVLMRAALEKARAAGAPFNMHQSQSIDDAEFDDRRYGEHPLVHQAKEGLLGPDVVLTHMNILREDEFRPLIESGASVIWCTNSWYYGSRTAYRNPMPRLIDAGVNVTMGLDVSKAAGFGAELMFMGYMMARDQGEYVSLEDLLQMQTRNAAKALMQEDLGSIEPGKRADIVIRTNDLPETRPAYHLPRQHFLVAQNRSVDTVLVDGRVVIRGGRHTWMDEQHVFALAEDAATAMRRGAGIG